MYLQALPVHNVNHGHKQDTEKKQDACHNLNIRRNEKN